MGTREAELCFPASLSPRQPTHTSHRTSQQGLGLAKIFSKLQSLLPARWHSKQAAVPRTLLV